MAYLGNQVAPLVQALEGKELKLDSDGDSSIQASTDDTVVFKTNGSNRWTLNSSGNLFPASTSQGIVLGATSDTSANRLDDYEEGTWTPAISGLSFTEAIGRYVKVGQVVHATFSLNTSNTSKSGGASITGLPFTGASNGSGETEYYAGDSAIMHVNNISFGSGMTHLFGRIEADANTVKLLGSNGTSHSASVNISSSGTIRGQVIYRSAS